MLPGRTGPIYSRDRDHRPRCSGSPDAYASGMCTRSAAVAFLAALALIVPFCAPRSAQAAAPAAAFAVPGAPLAVAVTPDGAIWYATNPAPNAPAAGIVRLAPGRLTARGATVYPVALPYLAGPLTPCGGRLYYVAVNYTGGQSLAWLGAAAPAAGAARQPRTYYAAFVQDVACAAGGHVAAIESSVDDCGCPRGTIVTPPTLEPYGFKVPQAPALDATLPVLPSLFTFTPGAIWTAGGSALSALDPATGRVLARFRADTLALASAPGARVWFLTKGALEFVDTALRLHALPLPRGLTARAGVSTSLVYGDDGAFWFPVQSGNSSGVGRMLPDGRFSLPVPLSGADIVAVAKGPNDVIFADENGRIGVLPAVKR